jgi:hypothetical protein
VLPEKIPTGGLIILRDGDPGEPEQALGGFAKAYYQHAVEIEVYVEQGEAAGRDAAFDNLLQQIETTLEADPTLSGLAFGMMYGRPEPAIEAVAGAPAIKTATLGTSVDLEFAYTLSVQAKLVLTAHDVYLPKPKLAVEGPGGVQASFDFRGAKNTAAGRMLTVTPWPDERPRWDGLRMTHNVLFRLAHSSVDVRP